MSVKLVTIKRHKYINWHLPGDKYEARDADAKILIARGLSRIAEVTAKPIIEKPTAEEKALTASTDVPRGTRKPRRAYKRRDMKAEE